MIWVEGPTERIYLNHWIREAAPGLQEGLHYSIFFYGGRLLSHLSAGDDDVGDIIKLRAINRNIALLMDSDRSSKFSKLNKTKKRIFDEISDHGGFPWITAGREIENYVPLKMINEALEHVHSSIFVRPIESGRYDHAFYFYAKRGGKEIVYESADKVKLARYVTGKPADLNVLDLREKITGLVAAIKLANKS
jgi:hypothetical protein